jgi:hypothetical protein
MWRCLQVVVDGFVLSRGGRVSFPVKDTVRKETLTPLVVSG